MLKLPSENSFQPELASLAAKFVRAFIECSDELQASVREMIAIIESPESDEQDRAMAYHTVAEILFSERSDAGTTLEELDECAAALQSDGPSAKAALEAQEESFAQRLRSRMQSSGLTQAELAARAGVGQPAISMMLRRECRPQRRTVHKLAEALGVKPEALWNDASAG